MKTEETTQPGGEKALVEQIASLQKQLDACPGQKAKVRKWGDVEWQLEYDKKLVQAAEIITDGRQDTYDYTYFLKEAFKAFVVSEAFAQSCMKSDHADMYSDLLRFVKECEEAQDFMTKNYKEEED